MTQNPPHLSSSPDVEIPRLKILLVDDTPLNLALAMKLLTRRGHQVVGAKNGQEALEAFCKESFDAVLMDIRMPVMNGFEATRKIRDWESEQSNHTPIIAMTANDGESDRLECEEAGMDGFITKPFNIKTIDGTIRQIVARVRNSA